MDDNPYSPPSISQQPVPHRPVWVRWGLLGAASRTSAVQYNWLCMAAATFSLIVGTIDERFYLGGALYLFVIWSWFAIEWVDRQSRWEDVLPPEQNTV